MLNFTEEEWQEIEARLKGDEASPTTTTTTTTTFSSSSSNGEGRQRGQTQLFEEMFVVEDKEEEPGVQSSGSRGWRQLRSLWTPPPPLDRLKGQAVSIWTGIALLLLVLLVLLVG